jgi:hypothetical protein
MQNISRALMNETENLGVRSNEIEIMQADAWLAIFALCKSLDTELETTSEVWSRAISRTEEWRNILTSILEVTEGDRRRP